MQKRLKEKSVESRCGPAAVRMSEFQAATEVKTWEVEASNDSEPEELPELITGCPTGDGKANCD